MAERTRQLTRIAILDDHLLFAEALAAHLAICHAIVGVATSSYEFLQIVAKEQPEVALLDISLDFENGLDLVPRLHINAPLVSVLVVSMFDCKELRAAAARGGARGFVSKLDAMDVLLAAIDEVVSGGSWWREPTRSPVPTAARVNERISLSPRQVDVARQLALGKSYKEIGAALGLSENTVDVYLRRIRTILGARNAVELVELARDRGLLGLERGGHQ